jgi:hypothetical protein
MDQAAALSKTGSVVHRTLHSCMAHGKRSHASLRNVENNMARKWINGLLCCAEARARCGICAI